MEERDFWCFWSDKHIKNMFIRYGLIPLSYCSLLWVCGSSNQVAEFWRLRTCLGRGSMFLICACGGPNWSGCSSWESWDLCFLFAISTFLSLRKGCSSWTCCCGSLLLRRTQHLSSLCDDEALTLFTFLSIRIFWAVVSGKVVAHSSSFAYWCSCLQFHLKSCLRYWGKHHCRPVGRDRMRSIRSVCLSFISLLSLVALLHCPASASDVHEQMDFRCVLILSIFSRIIHDFILNLTD